MRHTIIIILFFLSLTGCANYAGIHANAKPYTMQDIEKPHTYELPPKATLAAQNHWWQRFHDAQLDQLINTALSNSPNMQAAISRVRQAEFLANGEAANLFPSVDFSGSFQRERFAKYGLIPPPFNGKIFNISEFGLNFNYEFDFWGKNRQALAARVSEICAARADAAEARLVIASSVANYYFQLLSDIKQLSIAEALLQQRKAALDIVTYRLKNGIASDIPVTSAYSDVETSKLLVEHYKLAKITAQNQLAVLVGNNPFTTDIKLPQYHYQASSLQFPDVISVNVLAQRPDVAAASLRATAASHQIESAKATFFPDINLTALYSYQSILTNHILTAANRNNIIGGAIDLPIFDAGARRANLGERYTEYDIAVDAYNNTVLNALSDIANQVKALQVITNQLTAQNESVAAINHSYQLTRLQYQHGIIDYLQVLEIKISLLQQQATQANYQAQHLLTTVAMMKAMGGDYNKRVS